MENKKKIYKIISFMPYIKNNNKELKWRKKVDKLIYDYNKSYEQNMKAQKYYKLEKKGGGKSGGFTNIFNKQWAKNATLDRFLKWMSPALFMLGVDAMAVGAVFIVKEISKSALFLGGLSFPQIILFSGTVIGCAAGVCLIGFLLHSAVLYIKSRPKMNKNYNHFYKNKTHYQGKNHIHDKKLSNIGKINKSSYNNDKKYENVNYYGNNKPIFLGQTCNQNDRNLYSTLIKNNKKFDTVQQKQNNKISNNKKNYYSKLELI